MSVAARLRQLQKSIGQSAATATGADIPRPRPVAEALPSAPSKDAMVLMPRQQLAPAQVNALLRKMNDGQDLTLQELYYLTDAGALPDASLSQIDNLETSGIELPDTEVTPRDNLTPNTSKVKEGDVDRVYNEINNLANPQEAANQRQVTRTLGLLKKVLADPDAKEALYARFGDAKFAEARINDVRGLAGDSVGREAAKIDAAAQSRDAAGAPRPQGRSLPVAEAQAGVSRTLAAGELPQSLPELAEAFNALPQDMRMEVSSRLERSSPSVARLFRVGEDGVTIPGESVSRLMTPKSDFDGLLLDLENARRIGDPDLEEAVKADIRREIGTLAETDRDGLQAAVREYQQRQDAIGAIGREMVASRPDVSADIAAARQAAVTPAAPSVRAPGARSVEVSGPALDEAELPSTYDDALARLREQLFENQIRPSNPVTAAEAKALAEAAGMETRELPVALKGRLEDRSLASRGGVSTREENALEALRTARGQLATSINADEKSLADEAVAAAQTQVNRAFGTNPRAKSDAALNRQSQKELARSLFDTIVGARDRPGQKLSRSSVEFTGRERDLNAADAQDTLSFDPEDTTPADMMPEGLGADDMEMLGEGGKRGRLGGRASPARQAAAMERFFSSAFGPGVNPLDPEKFPEFGGDPRKVADYVMRTEANTRIEGTPSFELARDEFASAVEGYFGPNAARGPQVGIDGAEPSLAHLNAPVSDTPAIPTGTTQDLDAIPSLDPDTPNRAAYSPTNLPGPKPLASDVNLEASATDITDPATLPPVGEPTAATPGAAGTLPPVEAPAATGGRKMTRDEIEAEATRAEQEAYTQAVDEGMSPKKARAAANKRRKEVQKQLLAESGTLPPVADPTPAAKPAADAAPAAKAGGETIDPIPDPADKGGKGSKGGRSKNAKPDASTKPDDVSPSKSAAGGDASAPKSDPDPDGKPAPKTEPKKSWFTMPRVLAGLAGAGVIAANMGGGSSNVTAGGPITVPPGSGAGGMDDAEAEADAITRALERIRGSRRNDGAGTTQVLQNWTGWR